MDVTFGLAADFAQLEPEALGRSDYAETYRAKVDFIWHDILHAVAAIDRGRQLRALFYIERLRHGAIELASARLGLDARHHKRAVELPGDLRDLLIGRRPVRPSPPSSSRDPRRDPGVFRRGTA